MADLRLALRLLWKDKTFALTAAVTLAVCMAANVALFTVVDHVLLQRLRIPESDRVLLVYNSYPKAGADHAGATVPDLFDRLSALTVFEEQALFNTRNPSLDVNGTPERIHTMQVTPSFFRLVRVRPRTRRAFTPEEGEIGKNHVIILSDPLCLRLFGSAEAIGRDIRLDGERYVVIGVMPTDFILIDANVRAWIPLAFTDQQKTRRYSNNWAYLGRLKPGASVAQAQAQINALNAANLERFPETRQVLTRTGFHTVAVPLQDDLVRDVRPLLYLLWSGALFLLLIGCVNVASLVLVRSRVRLKELATRLALGASRWRLMRQLVTEHLVLTSGSAAAGLVLGYASLRLLGHVSLEALPRNTEITIDMGVVAWTLLMAGAIGITLGAIPLLAGGTVSLTAILRQEGRGGTGGRGVQILRRVLIVTQIAIAFVLLIGAGLLLASFRRVLAIDPGFDTDGVLTASVNLPPRYSDHHGIEQFATDAVCAIRTLPGVVSVGVTTSIPFGDDFSQDVLLPEGYGMTPGESLIAPYASSVTPEYFEAMRVPLRRGRFFEDRDTAESLKVVIVDERLARRFWPGADPVGRRMFEPGPDRNDLFAISDKTPWFTVIGVVKEMKLRGLVEGVGDTGAFYTALAQRPAGGLTFAIRTSDAPLSVANAIRTEIARIDRELPVFEVQTMTDRTERSLITRRSPMLLSLAFGFIAVLLAAVGIYGVLAYLVAHRTKEIGIRMALGSTHRGVFRLIMQEGLLLITLGFVVGAGGLVALKRSLQSLLFGVTAGDPVVLLSVIATLGCIGLAACAIPARRATRIDPAVALAE
jgi:predicted permease